MSQSATLTAASESSSNAGNAEHFDVLIVGAGISGVGGAYHLTQQCPGKSFVVLETLESFGGTWLTHKYPGIRSDSDLYTFGYRFKPWTSAPIASAEEILKYMGEVIDENDLAQHIRYHHRIDNATWSTEDKLWTIEATKTDTNEKRTFTANFLWMCQGYYRHSEGYTPDWPGLKDFKGRVIHPQTWPDDADLAGKDVLVIGSGATAATLVPAIAGQCGSLTMLQRSPTYFVTGRNANELADILRQLEIDETWIHEIVRRKILFDQAEVTRRSFEDPDGLKNDLLTMARAYLPEETIQKHFMPRYRPWQQRIAFIPDGDVFQGVASGAVKVVTDDIDTFTATGVRTKSGEEIKADVVITATGFNINVLGDVNFTIDGKPMNFHDTVTYRGMMFTGIPNMVWVFGYFRASWTLRADMVADFVCRLLQHMDEKGAREVVPALRPEDADMPLTQWIDEDNFNPGYLKRGMHLMPHKGNKPEWQHNQDYWYERTVIPTCDLDDGCLQYLP